MTPTREQIAFALMGHRPTQGMQVASGRTCQCGHWNGNDRGLIHGSSDGLDYHRADIVLALLNEEDEVS